MLVTTAAALGNCIIYLAYWLRAKVCVYLCILAGVMYVHVSLHCYATILTKFNIKNHSEGLIVLLCTKASNLEAYDACSLQLVLVQQKKS